MQYDFEGAQRAGISSADILRSLQSGGDTSYDFDGARAAGVSDDDIVRSLSGRAAALPPPGAPAAAPGAPAATPGAPAQAQAAPAAPQGPGWFQTGVNALQSGASNIAQNIGQSMQVANIPGGKAVENYGTSIAPAGYKPSEFDTLTPNTYGQLPQAVAEGVPSLVTSLAARAVGAGTGAALGMLAGPVGAVAGGVIGGFTAPTVVNAAMVYGPTALALAKANGRETPNDDDKRQALYTAGASGAVDTLSMGVGRVASTLPRQIGQRFLGEAAGEGTQDVIEQVGRTANTPGGVSVDPRAALNAGVVGGFTGSTVHAVTGTTGAAAERIREAVTAHRAGPDLGAFATETADWTKATREASERIKKADPTMAPPDVEAAAYREASAAGVKAPTYDSLSPQAQNGMAELAALQMYRARLETETVGMGRPNAKPQPDTVFKGVLGDIRSNLTETVSLLTSRGLIDSGERTSFLAAINDAARHNRNIGVDGEQYSYFATNQDRVANLPIDSSIKNHLLMQLRVLDAASQNSLKLNAMGPLERNRASFGLLTGAALGGLGVFAPGAAGAAAGVVLPLVKAAGRSSLRGLDRMMGTQLPDLLRRQGTIENFAKDNNLQAGTTPGDLMAINSDLRDLGPAPGASRSPPQASGFPARQPMVPRTPKGPLRASQAVPDQGAPYTSPSVVQGTTRSPAPVNALLQAQVAQQGADNAAMGDLIRGISGAPRVQGWLNKLGEVSGLSHAEVRTELEALASQDPTGTMTKLLSQPRLPEEAMYAFSDHLNNLRGQKTQGAATGTAPGAATGTAPGGKVIYNPMSYQGAINNALDAQRIARERHPEHAGHINMVSVEQSKPARRAKMEEILRGLPEAERGPTRAVLEPLTVFGAAEATTRPAPLTPASRGGAGPSRGAPETGLFGVDKNRRQNTSVGPEGRADRKRFMRDSTAPGEARPDRGQGAGKATSPADFTERPAVTSAQEFHDAIKAAKTADPHGASVTLYDAKDYRDMRLFLTPGGKAGFALKGDDIVSVFKHPDSNMKGVASAVLDRAVLEGGKRLDAFDTALPGLYSKGGFRAVARVPFSDEYAPDGWRTSDYSQYNGGKPDVVFMVHDPANAKPYQAGDGKKVSEYDDGVAAQTAALSRGTPTMGDNGGPALESEKPQTPRIRDRLASEARALNAQKKAEAEHRRNPPTAEERSFMLIDALDGLDNGVKAEKRGRLGVTVAEQELLPNRTAPIIKWADPGSADKIADYITKEAVHALTKSDNALDWYDQTITRAMAFSSELYPELATDKQAAFTFKALLAITSNGQNVVQNHVQTTRMYATIRAQVLKGDYTLPLDYKWAGTTAPSMKKGAAMWNNLLAKLGSPEKLQTFLTSQFTAGELAGAVKAQTGKTYKPSGELVDSLIYGGSVLGPKIGGGFFMNLMGIYDPLTMDRWWIRTISRVSGDMVNRDTPQEFANRLGEFTEVLRSHPNAKREFGLDGPTLTKAKKGNKAALEAVARVIFKQDNKEGYPRLDNGKEVASRRESLEESDNVRKAAKPIPGAVDGVMKMSPEGGKHRKWQRGIATKVLSNLKAMGINLTTADFQALVWFPEQRYWQQVLGVGSAKTDANYEHGAGASLLRQEGGEARVREVYESFGYSPGEINSRIDHLKIVVEKLTKAKAENPDED